MRSLTVATILVCATACSHANPEPAPAPAPAPEPQVVVRTVTDTVRVRDPELDRQVARLEAKVAERDTRIADLEARLEEAQAEVVRTMASAPGSTLRAEAASAIAEAEVATKSPRGASSSDIATAKKLLDRATEAFNGSNFRGARYLADQAKALVAPGRREVIATRTVRPGERAFDAPVGFTARQRANVREGPGTSFRVVFKVEKGATLTGESSSKDWIRVSDENGRRGWIVKSLLVPATSGSP